MKFLISHVILHQLKDPRVGLVTVLDVIPTEDLKEAKVYVSVFGSAGDRSKTEHALNGARAYIQSEVGKNLETRNTPILRFVFDDSAEKLSKIEGLIQQASQQDRESTMAKKPSNKDRGAEFTKDPPSPIENEDEAIEEESKEDEAKGEDDFDADFDAEESDDADNDLDEDFEEEEEEDDDPESFDGDEDDDPEPFDDDDDDDDGDDDDEPEKGD
jgi:ribosome-binding factor A